MTERAKRHEISTRPVLYELPGAQAVEVRRDVDCRPGGAARLLMDIYYPPNVHDSVRPPAVVIVAGFPDPGFERIVGCKFKEMESCISWARLIAASGLAAIVYSNQDPVADADELLRYLRGHAAALRLDENRLGLWASSGNVPVALSLLMNGARPHVKCAVMCYPYTLDLDGSSEVASAAAMFRFANATAGRSVDDLPADVPLFIARAGRDEMPNLNGALDRFVAKAIDGNLPLTFVNHPDGPHSFDLLHDSATTREIVGQILTFLRSKMKPEAV